MEAQILFVGGGNMGRAIIGGLLGTGYPAHRITVADPDQSVRERLRIPAPPRTSSYSR